jgi:hypothetical protein
MMARRVELMDELGLMEEEGEGSMVDGRGKSGSRSQQDSRR